MKMEWFQKLSRLKESEIVHRGLTCAGHGWTSHIWTVRNFEDCPPIYFLNLEIGVTSTEQSTCFSIRQNEDLHNSTRHISINSLCLYLCLFSSPRLYSFILFEKATNRRKTRSLKIWENKIGSIINEVGAKCEWMSPGQEMSEAESEEGEEKQQTKNWESREGFYWLVFVGEI